MALMTDEMIRNEKKHFRGGKRIIEEIHLVVWATAILSFSLSLSLCITKYYNYYGGEHLKIVVIYTCDAASPLFLLEKNQSDSSSRIGSLSSLWIRLHAAAITRRTFSA